MYCAECGKVVNEKAVLCPSCGCKVKGGAPGEVSSWLLVFGYLGCLFIPLIGIVIGIILMVKGIFNHGTAMIVLSLISWIIALVIFSGGY